MHLKIRFFGSVKDEAGRDSFELDIPDGGNLMDLESTLRRELPQIWSGRSQLFFAVNQKYADRNESLRESDEIALFPMVSGG